MANEYSARIQLRCDSSSNWTAYDPVLLEGEKIVVITDVGETRYKIGDGVKKYTQLPFDDEVMRNLVNNKQDKITGSVGQYIAVGADGKIVAVDSEPISSGVYYGTDTPGEEYDVWVDSDAEEYAYVVDATLSQYGCAADAQTVGNVIATLINEISALKNNSDVIISDEELMFKSDVLTSVANETLIM